MRASVLALAGTLLSVPSACARRERIVGRVPRLSDCPSVPAPPVTVAAGVAAAGMAEAAEAVEVAETAQAFNIDNTGLAYRREDIVPHARLHQIWSLRFWLREHRPPAGSFMATAAQLLNVTRRELSDRLGQTSLAGSRASRVVGVHDAIKRLYCQGLVFQAWLLYPIPPFEWSSDAPWPEEGVPAINVSQYMPADRLRPIMGALYARHDGTSRFVVVR